MSWINAINFHISGLVRRGSHLEAEDSKTAKLKLWWEVCKPKNLNTKVEFLVPQSHKSEGSSSINI